MGKWIYTLSASSELKAAIVTGMDGCYEQLADIMLALEKCAKEANSFFKGNNDEVYEFVNLIDGEANLVRINDPLIAEMGFRSPRALVEGRLDDFYDICDNNRIWIAPNKPV